MPRPAARAFAARALIAGLLAWALAVTAAAAQDAQIRLGQSLRLSDAPIEIDADELEVDQATGASVFRGNVRAAQGEMVLTAGDLRLEYSRATEAGGRTRIDRLVASGGVTFVTPSESAEAAEATYSLADQTLEMRGDVMLVQGQNVLSGQNFRADLGRGTGAMTGNVRTRILLD